MARQWTSVLRGLIGFAVVGIIVARFGVTTRADSVGDSAVQQSLRLLDVVAGQAFGCALSSDGSVHCWGANDKGQLGIGTMDSASHGVTRLPGDLRFRSLRAGFNTVCGVTEQNDAFCWGAGDWAQLGNGRWGHSAVPTPVTGGLKFRAVMPGGTITCGVAIGGELYCWGGNNHGQAGVGDKNGDPDTSCCYKRPRRVAADRLFIAVMAGGIHGCAVDAGGKGYCWGYQHDGRLGNGEPGTARNVPDLPAPVPISTDATLTAMAGRSWHTCAFAANGDLLCWGLGEHGRLGNGSAESRPVPTRVVTPTPFKTVSVGSRHSCGVTAAGIAYCWGSNESGEVGGTASGPVVLPREVQALRGVSAIAAGGTEAGHGFTCAIATGRLVCWGANNQGQKVEWNPQ